MITLALIVTLFGATLLYLFNTYLPIYSSFAAVVLYVGLAHLLWGLIDKYVLKGIDTNEELKKQNIAYSIYLLAVAIIIAAAVITG